ncbi:hypothetical protein QBC38DRAFT_503414 [Podospora fimiseda]|uniref:Transmembrane protein n=1 Tax=Podospora fimiseda TaxID=252190 RepID=A0AAN7BGW8_9PEZI|nr:hypothetical protein QBC38DRAFT_503414 [Podospora fimiseda]
MSLFGPPPVRRPRAPAASDDRTPLMTLQQAAAIVGRPLTTEVVNLRETMHDFPGYAAYNRQTFSSDDAAGDDDEEDDMNCGGRGHSSSFVFPSSDVAEPQAENALPEAQHDDKDAAMVALAKRLDQVFQAFMTDKGRKKANKVKKASAEKAAIFWVLAGVSFGLASGCLFALLIIGGFLLVLWKIGKDAWIVLVDGFMLGLAEAARR